MKILSIDHQFGIIYRKFPASSAFKHGNVITALECIL